MEKRFTIFDFFSEAFNTFSIMVICIAFTARFVGKDAGTISSLYSFGSDGIAVDTIVQFLLVSLVMEGSKVFWFSEKLLKHMTAFWRTVGMVLSVIPIITVFAGVFDWFPLNNLYAWCGFLTAFSSCFALSLLVIYIKTKLENRKIEKGFERYRKEHGLEEDDEQS